MNEMAMMSDQAAKQGEFLPPSFREIDDDTVAALVRDIEKNGFAVVPNYINADLLAELRHFVMKLVDASGGEYTVLSGREEMPNTLLEAVGSTPSFVHFLHRLYEKGTGKPVPAQSIYQLLRCLTGKTGLQHAYFFHYDSYVVTALMPLITPSEGKTGDLVMIPNARKIRGSYFANVFDKLLVDNKFSQTLFRKRAVAEPPRVVKVKIVPGNLYLFWGYRSIHANEECDADKIRATALFHFGDPHMESKLRRFTGSADARAKIEAQAL